MNLRIATLIAISGVFLSLLLTQLNNWQLLPFMKSAGPESATRMRAFFSCTDLMNRGSLILFFVVFLNKQNKHSNV